MIRGLRGVGAVAIILAVCGICLGAERPTINIPSALREANYGSGSCVHATMISIMRWQGQYRLADYWRKTYYGGELIHGRGLASKFDDTNVRYAYTTSGDVKFLEWATSTRRGCGITVAYGSHMVTLVHLDDEWAAILDNNDISKYVWIPREVLIAEWKRSQGWAVTVIYTPPAPLPVRGAKSHVSTRELQAAILFRVSRYRHTLSLNRRKR